MAHRPQFGSLLTMVVLALPRLSFAPQVVSSSARLPETMAWEALNEGIADGDAEHRRQAIVAAGTIGSAPQAVQIVQRGLEDKNALVRQTAAVTLGEMGARSAIPDLKKALDDDPEVSFSAAKALWDLGDPAGREIVQEVMEGERTDTPGKLKGALRDAKHKLRPAQLVMMGVKEASGALLGPASIGVVAAEEAVKETRKDAGAPGRVIAAGILAKDPGDYALTLLEWSLSDKSGAVRLAVAKALGERGNQETMPKLVIALSDDRRDVRYMAAASLVKLSLTKTANASR
jgi:HEAT repeat protein